MAVAVLFEPVPTITGIFELEVELATCSTVSTAHLIAETFSSFVIVLDSPVVPQTTRASTPEEI